MHPKNSTPNFNIEKQSIPQHSCPNRSVQNFSVYDDYQYKKVTTKQDSKDPMFHSHIFDQSETFKQQILELQKQIKIKELSYQQLATAFFQQQQKFEELKTAFTKVEEEKKYLQKEIQNQVEKNEFNQFDMKQLQEINTLFQNENTQLKLAAVKLKDTIVKLQIDNKQLKDQIESLMTNPLSCERKGSSRLSFDYLLNEAEQTQTAQGVSGTSLPNFEKNCICSKKIIHIQAEIKKYQKQLYEKDQLIEKLTQQNIALQKAQMKLQKSQKKQNLFGTPETEIAKQDPILVQDDSNDTSRQLNTYLSDRGFNVVNNLETQIPVLILTENQLKTSSSARSVLINKSKKEVEQMYKKNELISPFYSQPVFDNA
ncbi:unnamed protein product (macronuclear) [Paramecium tetraurelia]|uniref:Uncharacterized protein n=1 Tax=Paramecium tetraurelia TaxID=5888 RepID=A0D2L7_PARTE|nr:uncharacterized protein GSPATT00012792001 [Paramecium tetraurelia]CAK77284.1 unnamed protein product [Paramecium tetraurelia]|eukprot:XP_001444681.1 hypothetical protein (macronuclear) [Paramecium tetraurelia strain d4-2]